MQADPLTLRFNESIIKQVALVGLSTRSTARALHPSGTLLDAARCYASVCYGEEGIPAEWRDKLVLCETIE